MQPAFQLLPHWAQIALAVIPAFSATLAAIALLLNVFQTRRTNAQSRATLVAGCLKGFAEDDEIQKAFYSIEYSEFIYDVSFHRSDAERSIDRLLRHFANTALAWEAGLLSTRDLRPLQYYLIRVLQNPEIQKYLSFIEQWSKQSSTGAHPYLVLVRLGKALSDDA